MGHNYLDFWTEAYSDWSFNLLVQIFDKLCQNFIGDVLQMLFHSAEELARCPPETQSMRFWIRRFISDQVLAVVTSNILFLWVDNFFMSNYFIIWRQWIKQKCWLFSLTSCTCSFCYLISSGNHFISLYCFSLQCPASIAGVQ